jgi:hypothetical protein
MQPTHHRAAETATHPPSRRWDGAPETDHDRRYFDLRGSGDTGPADQDGNAAPTVPIPVTTVAHTLRDAARYLSRHGWTQGCYYDQTAQCFTPAACLVGALGIVCYGGPVDAPALNDTDPGFADFEAARDYLDSYLSRTLPYDVDCYGYNDHTGRTADDVIVVLTEAAARCELAALVDADPIPGGAE